MPDNRKIKIVAGIVASFTVFAGTIVVLAEAKVIGFQMASLMLVALLGMYVGFGILIAVYRLVVKLK